MGGSTDNLREETFAHLKAPSQTCRVMLPLTVSLVLDTTDAPSALSKSTDGEDGKISYPVFDSLRLSGSECSAEHDGPLSHGLCNFGRQQVLG